MLLAMNILVAVEPAVDDRGEPIQLRPLDKRRPPEAGRDRKRHGLVDSVARNVEMARRSALAHAVGTGQTNLQTKFHGVDIQALHAAARRAKWPVFTPPEAGLSRRYRGRVLHRRSHLNGLKFRTAGLASEMATKLGMAAEAMSGSAMFQALQTGALDAGEFIGPWSDPALGYHQVAPYYYWPGLGEPSSAKECGVNAEVFAALPDDLKEVVAQACAGLYNPVWTEYTTKHAQSLKAMVADHEVQVRKLPDDVIAAMGVTAEEIIVELLADEDELVQRITASFVAYHDLVGVYMSYADNGQMNARAGIFGY